MSTLEQDAAELVRLYDVRISLQNANASKARADELTGSDVDRVLVAGRVLDEACEAFKARWYPRRAGRVAVGLWSVFLVNQRGTVEIHDEFEQYAGARA